MTGELIAERLVEDVEDGAGSFARYSLYGAAAVAALIGAWLVAAPGAKTVPASAPLDIHATEMPLNNVRQIEIKAGADTAPAVPTTASAATPDAARPAAAPASQTASADPAPIPPKPIPRPAYVASIAPTPQSTAPIARAAAPPIRDAASMEPHSARPVQTGAPPTTLGVLRESAPVYSDAAPAYVPPQPAVAPAASYEPAGPVPPMPIEGQADDLRPDGMAIRHQGLLGASERAVSAAWDWTTGTVDGMVQGVQRGF